MRPQLRVARRFAVVAVALTLIAWLAAVQLWLGIPFAPDTYMCFAVLTSLVALFA